ncbi:MAG: host attachment protein [Pseudomonadota bacterium]|nr:host attachment protein [Pseudomonadota bacterium]
MAKKEETIWVLVADEAIARLLQHPDDGSDLVPVEEMTDPKAHARNAELRHDAHGRREGGQPATRPGSGQPQGAAANATTSAGPNEKHQEAELFARTVAQRLTERLQQRRFTELQIAAAPRFLGLLRKALSQQVAATVTRELDKDLIHESTAELSQRFFSDPA